MMPKQKKRRVVPQLISPATAAAAAALNPLAHGIASSGVQPSGVTAPTSLRDQAEDAKKYLGPGRRMYVDISEKHVINYQKLLKEAGVPREDDKKKKKAARADGEISGPTGSPPLPDMPREIGQPKQTNNIFASVIQRLESVYVNAADDSDSEEGEGDTSSGAPSASGGSGAVSGASSDGNESEEEGGPEASGAAAAALGGAEGGAQGSPSDPQQRPLGGGEAPAGAKKRARATARASKDDIYDLEDEFIDDSEFIEYYGGDRRRAKHRGFFINKGEIEREEGPARVEVTPTPPPRKKKRRVGLEGGPQDGQNALPGPSAAPAAAKPRKQPKASDGSGPQQAAAASFGLAPVAAQARPATAIVPPPPAAAAATALPDAHTGAAGSGGGGGTAIGGDLLLSPPLAGRAQAAAAFLDAPSQAPPPVPPADDARHQQPGAGQQQQQQQQEGGGGGHGPASDLAALIRRSLVAGTVSGTGPPAGATSNAAAAAGPPPTKRQASIAGPGEAYEVSDEMRAWVDRIRASTQGEVDRRAASEGEAAPRNRALPKRTREELEAFAPRFQAECLAYPRARKVLLRHLMDFLEPFTSRPNLVQKLARDAGGGDGGGSGGGGGQAAKPPLPTAAPPAAAAAAAPASASAPVALPGPLMAAAAAAVPQPAAAAAAAAPAAAATGSLSPPPTAAGAAAAAAAMTSGGAGGGGGAASQLSAEFLAAEQQLVASIRQRAQQAGLPLDGGLPAAGAASGLAAPLGAGPASTGSDDDFAPRTGDPVPGLLDKGLEEMMYDHVARKAKELGLTLMTKSGRALYKEVAAMFPEGSGVDETLVQRTYNKVYNRRMSRELAKRKRLERAAAAAGGGGGGGGGAPPGSEAAKLLAAQRPPTGAVEALPGSAPVGVGANSMPPQQQQQPEHPTAAAAAVPPQHASLPQKQEWQQAPPAPSVTAGPPLQQGLAAAAAHPGEIPVQAVHTAVGPTPPAPSAATAAVAPYPSVGGGNGLPPTTAAAAAAPVLAQQQQQAGGTAQGV